jgi:hypothetical protein
MAATPDETAPGTARMEIPADDVADEDVDVLTLAGQRLPAEGAWLWVTAANGTPGGEITALFLPRNRPQASGGDVLIRLTPGTDDADERWPVPTARVQVWAVVAGSLVPVAAWDRLDLDEWPEAVRATVAFAMGALTELEAHHADVGAREQVDVETAAGAAAAGFPSLPTGAGTRE